MPITPPALGFGTSSISQQSETKYLPVGVFDIVAFRMWPFGRRDILAFTLPIFGKAMQLPSIRIPFDWFLVLYD